jgi:hypothetical protein
MRVPVQEEYAGQREPDARQIRRLKCQYGQQPVSDCEQQLNFLAMMSKHGNYAALSALSRSLMISSMASIPAEIRTRLSRMPIRSRIFGEISRCEDMAG